MSGNAKAEAAIARAEAVFKGQRTRDATGEDKHGVETAQTAEAGKIAKLRALRLAKEESDRLASEVRKARRDLRRP